MISVFENFVTFLNMPITIAYNRYIAKNLFTVFINIAMIQNDIKNSYGTSFTSRNKLIRRADDIARRINCKYPRVSCTNIVDFKNILGHEDVYNRLAEKINDMRKLISSEMKNSDSYLSEVKVLPQYVSEWKLGNCDESAKLALIAAKVNNINDGKLGLLFSLDSKKYLDHIVLFVKNDKNPYIIDPWLGFADFLPNATQRYKTEYNYHFDLNGEPKEQLILDPCGSYFGIAADKVSPKKLKANFRELILPKPYKKSLASKIHNKFKTIYLLIKNKFNL